MSSYAHYYYSVSLPVRVDVSQEQLDQWFETHKDDPLDYAEDWGEFSLDPARATPRMLTLSFGGDVPSGFHEAADKALRALAREFADWTKGVMDVHMTDDEAEDGPHERYFGPQKAVLAASIKLREEQLARRELELVHMRKEQETAGDELVDWLY